MSDTPPETPAEPREATTATPIAETSLRERSPTPDAPDEDDEPMGADDCKNVADAQKEPSTSQVSATYYTTDEFAYRCCS
jgi:hypothetical protein